MPWCCSPGGRRRWPRSRRRRKPSPNGGPNCRASPKFAGTCPNTRPRNFHEALQYYWFCHLAVITELNGWDSFNPGHLDQHLLPFYRQGLADGSLTHDAAPRAAGVFLHQVQQPSRAAQGGRHRRRERHLHRLRQHQHRRPAPPTARTAPMKFPTSCWISWTRCTCSSPAPTSSSRAKARTTFLSTRCA